MKNFRTRVLLPLLVLFLIGIAGWSFFGQTAGGPSSESSHKSADNAENDPNKGNRKRSGPSSLSLHRRQESLRSAPEAPEPIEPNSIKALQRLRASLEEQKRALREQAREAQRQAREAGRVSDPKRSLKMRLESKSLREQEQKVVQKIKDVEKKMASWTSTYKASAEEKTDQ
ncbi:MAG: hypothetical protein GY832_47160 [Chloroflexi bacterium]|nr:hypothetical protein [Chloroflexota bacterium]